MPGGARPKRRAYYFEKDWEDFVRRKTGLPAIRLIASGAGSPNPAVDVVVSGTDFPNLWQVKERAELPKWLFDPLRRVTAVAVRQPRGQWFVVMEAQDLIDYCRLPKEA